MGLSFLTPSSDEDMISVYDCLPCEEVNMKGGRKERQMVGFNVLQLTAKKWIVAVY